MRLETFVVRIWTGPDAGSESMPQARQPGAPAPEPGAATDLHGVVRHVRTGAEQRFADPQGLLLFLAADRPDATAAIRVPGVALPAVAETHATDLGAAGSPAVAGGLEPLDA